MSSTDTAGAGRPAEPYRVVVVEDDPDTAGYLETVLARRGGMVVRRHTSALDALASLAADAPEVVVTDIEMPGMSGLDLIPQVRAVDAAVAIVVMTAHASVTYAVDALRRDADEFLVKPVRGADLLDTVTRLAEQTRARRAASMRETRAAQRVLAVGAHPDDVEIAVGGALAAHAAAGDLVSILTLSGGARGGDMAVRRSEAEASAATIGAQLFLEDFEDTAIQATGDVVRAIEAVIARVTPTIVYTHSEHDRHQDHRATYQATAVGARRVGTLACWQSPSTTLDYRPNRFIDIDAHLETKLAMIGAFASQAGREYMDPDLVTATARYWSRAGGGRYCEPLQVVREQAVRVGQGGAS